MAKYAELCFAGNEKDIPISKIFIKLPPSIKNKIIKWKLPLTYQEIITWDTKGEKIQIPMTYTIYRKMPLPLKKKVFKKIEKKLRQRGITHVILPKLINTFPFETIEGCRGDYIKPFFIMEVIRFISKEGLINKSLQDLEVLILDGDKKDVDMMIDFIYPHINHLTVISKDPERFQDKAEYILSDVGLNMRVLSYTKGAISQGDIIIDTHYDDPSVIRFCKPNVVYLDMGNHIEKTMMLLERQNGVPIIYEFLLNRNGETISTTKAELLLTVNKIVSRDHKMTMRKIKKQNIKIDRLII